MSANCISEVLFAANVSESRTRITVVDCDDRGNIIRKTGATIKFLPPCNASDLEKKIAILAHVDSLPYVSASVPKMVDGQVSIGFTVKTRKGSDFAAIMLARMSASTQDAYASHLASKETAKAEKVEVTKAEKVKVTKVTANS